MICNNICESVESKAYFGMAISIKKKKTENTRCTLLQKTDSFTCKGRLYFDMTDSNTSGNVTD